MRALGQKLVFSADTKKPTMIFELDVCSLVGKSGPFVTRIQSLNSLHTSGRSDCWYSIELPRGPFQATTTEEWTYPIVRSI